MQPDRTETKRPAHRAETLVGTTRLGTLAGVVFAAVTVHSQTRSGQTLAAAIVAGPQIDARVLAGPVAVSQQALVDICTVMERDVNFEGKLTLEPAFIFTRTLPSRDSLEATGTQTSH